MPFTTNLSGAKLQTYSAFGKNVLGATIWPDTSVHPDQYDTMVHRSDDRAALSVTTGITALLFDYTYTFIDVANGQAIMCKLFALISESFANVSYKYLDIISFFSKRENYEKLIKGALIIDASVEGLSLLVRLLIWN